MPDPSVCFARKRMAPSQGSVVTLSACDRHGLPTRLGRSRRCPRPATLPTAVAMLRGHLPHPPLSPVYPQLPKQDAHACAPSSHGDHQRATAQQVEAHPKQMQQSRVNSSTASTSGRGVQPQLLAAGRARSRLAVKVAAQAATASGLRFAKYQGLGNDFILVRAQAENGVRSRGAAHSSARGVLPLQHALPERARRSTTGTARSPSSRRSRP